MAKFLALVRNENLKLRRRKALLIMTILLLSVSLLTNAIIVIANRAIEKITSSDYYINDISLEEECRSQLAYYREIEEKEGTNEFTKQKIAYYTMLLDIHATRDDWRYTTNVVSLWAQAHSRDDAETAARLETIIRGDDCFSYYAYQIEQNEAWLDEAHAAAANEGYRYCLEHKIAPDDWRYEVAMRLGELSLQLLWSEDAARAAGYAVGKSEVMENEYALAKYRLEHNTKDYFSEDMFSMNDMINFDVDRNNLLWSSLRITLSLTSVLNLFSIIIAAGLVASEFGKGTVKFLLITPASRWKILLAKYCCMLLHTAIMLGVLFVSNLLFGVLFCGGGGNLFKPILTASGGAVHFSSPLLMLMGYYLLGSVSVVVTATLAFAISSLFRNSAAAVGVSMLVQFGGNLVNTILSAAEVDWGRYLIFANLDLVSIKQGISYYPRQSMGVAVVILLLHMAVFLLTAFDAFDRKEV